MAETTSLSERQISQGRPTNRPKSRSKPVREVQKHNLEMDGRTPCQTHHDACPRFRLQLPVSILAAASRTRVHDRFPLRVRHRQRLPSWIQTLAIPTRIGSSSTNHVVLRENSPHRPFERAFAGVTLRKRRRPPPPFPPPKRSPPPAKVEASPDAARLLVLVPFPPLKTAFDTTGGPNKRRGCRISSPGKPDTTQIQGEGYRRKYRL